MRRFSYDGPPSARPYIFLLFAPSTSLLPSHDSLLLVLYSRIRPHKAAQLNLLVTPGESLGTSSAPLVICLKTCQIRCPLGS